MADSDFEQVVSDYHAALSVFFSGDPEPAKRFYSNRDDASLGNPFGPVATGWKQVEQTMERAASNYRDGEASGFARLAEYATPDLRYIVEVERYKAKVGGGEHVVPVALRVTTIFRPEDGTCKIVHRHADPITSVQQAESVVQR